MNWLTCEWRKHVKTVQNILFFFLIYINKQSVAIQYAYAVLSCTGLKWNKKNRTQTSRAMSEIMGILLEMLSQFNLSERQEDSRVRTWASLRAKYILSQPLTSAPAPIQAPLLLSGLLFCWASAFVGLHWAYIWVAANGGGWGTEYVSFTSDKNKPECYRLNTTMSMFHICWRKQKTKKQRNYFLSLSLGQNESWALTAVSFTNGLEHLSWFPLLFVFLCYTSWKMLISNL